MMATGIVYLMLMEKRMKHREQKTAFYLFKLEHGLPTGPAQHFQGPGVS